MAQQERQDPLLFERLVRGIYPRPDLSFTPAPLEIAPGLWSIERQVRFAGAVLPSRSTLVDVGSGRLLLLSPPADACAELDRLGAISAVVAPNSFHYLYAASCVGRHPDAQLFVAPGLTQRVPGLPRAFELSDDLAPAWRDALPYVVLGPHRGLSEVLFFHARSRTLILTDVASNVVQLRGAYERLLARASGLPRGFGTSRNARQLLLRDRESARKALRAAAGWPFERIVVAHGAVLERDAQRAFAAAFARYL
jgi:hypothetical protein